MLSLTERDCSNYLDVWSPRWFQWLWNVLSISSFWITLFIYGTFVIVNFIYFALRVCDIIFQSYILVTTLIILSFAYLTYFTRPIEICLLLPLQGVLKSNEIRLIKMVSCHLKKYTIPLKYYAFKAIIATGNASSPGNNSGIFLF